MLGEAIAFAIGSVASYFLTKINRKQELKKKGLDGITKIEHARKKKKRIWIKEFRQGFVISEEVLGYRNISIDDNKDIIIVAPGSIKPCYNFGGVIMGIADKYQACSIPQELRQTIVFLKLIGFKDSEIATYLTLVHRNKVEKADEFLEKKIEELIRKSEEEGNEEKAKMLRTIKEKKELYLATPSTIVEFLQTGICDITIHSLVKALVEEHQIQKLGQRNWLMILLGIGILIFLVLMGLGNLQGLFHPHAAIPPR